jgi:uncharacterized membrane protein YphA (DoxX/SURF4 family)
MQKTAPIVLRIGMALVVLWFGVQQLLDPSIWTGYLPTWTSSLPIGAVTFVLLNGWFECTFGLLLIAGFYTRFVALLLSLHLYGIAATLGLGELGVRDFGLATGLLSVFFYGQDVWSVDTFFSKKSS